MEIFPTPSQSESGTDCELDYDRDLDDDIYRPIDSDYDLVWDWKDTDVGGAFPPTIFLETQVTIPMTYHTILITMA